MKKLLITLTKYLNFIKFEHSIFALPFALSGAILATGNDGLPKFSTILWVTLAMVGARSLAMGLNRIIDKDIDAKNPRTKNRELPSGIITNFQAILFSIISLIVFLVATLNLPRICLLLFSIAVIWFYIYPYTKRFTSLSHIWLGIALGASVLAGWISVTGKIDSIIPFVLGLAVTFWVSGFDIIYGCQDYEFDKENKLYSIPAKLGIKNALIISRLFHATTILLLVWLGFLINSSFIYWLSIIFVSSMLLYEQSLVKPNDLSKVNIAFFTVNGWVSVSFFVFIVLDKVISGKI